MLPRQQLTNNIDVIFVTLRISVIQLPCSHHLHQLHKTSTATSSLQWIPPFFYTGQLESLQGWSVDQSSHHLFLGCDVHANTSTAGWRQLIEASTWQLESLEHHQQAGLCGQRLL